MGRPSPRRWTAPAAACAAAAAAAVLVAGASAAPVASCKPGFTRAVIGGKETCLRAGQQCRRTLDRQYHRYGFHCHGARLTRPAPLPAREADLMVSLEASPNPSGLGPFVLAARVTNIGTAAAPGASLALSIPGAPVISASSDAAAPSSCAVEQLTRVVCDLGTLQPGGRVVVTVAVRPRAAGDVAVSAAVGTGARDANRGNDSAQTTVTVLPGDAVRGTGLRSAYHGGDYRFTIDAWSGPRGESPQGMFRVEVVRGGSMLFAVGRVVCLTVVGAQAAVGAVVDETNDAAGFGRAIVFLVDDGRGARPDTSLSLLQVEDATACGLRPDLPQLPLLEGDFEVVDAP